jgi:hypothetical protein
LPCVPFTSLPFLPHFLNSGDKVANAEREREKGIYSFPFMQCELQTHGSSITRNEVVTHISVRMKAERIMGFKSRGIIVERKEKTHKSEAKDRTSERYRKAVNFETGRTLYVHYMYAVYYNRWFARHMHNHWTFSFFSELGSVIYIGYKMCSE